MLRHVIAAASWVLSALLVAVPASAGQQRGGFPTLDEQVRLTFLNQDHREIAGLLREFGASPQGTAALGYVLCEEYFVRRTMPNEALRLLIHLFRYDPAAHTDSMSAAIALANNYYYARGNNGVKALVLEDIEKQWRFYRYLLDWQRQIKVPLRLEQATMEAKIVWATRDRSGYPAKDTTEYLKRLPRIEEWEAMHRIVVRETGIMTKDSLSGINTALQTWFLSHRLPLAELPEDKKHIFFSDLFAFYRRKGEFPTQHCVATATFFWNIYRSVGIPVVTYYQNFNTAGSAGAGVAHEWPAYYDAALNRWETGQRSNPWPGIRTGQGNAAVDLEIFRPLWHHFIADEAQRFCRTADKALVARPAHIGGACRVAAYVERTRNALLREFVLRGMDDEVMRKIFTLPSWVTGTAGLISSGATSAAR
jgi:hypothetical protein